MTQPAPAPRPPRRRRRPTLAALVAALLIAAPAPLAAADGTDDPLLARDCAPGQGCTQTWTLTSRLGHILEDYEARLGPANRAYRLLGIEFTVGPRPRIWYPNYGSGPRSIIIQLTRRARRDQALALFQLAHEAFHLLNPVKPGERTSVFEEGLASYFATRYAKANIADQLGGVLSEPTYRTAYDLIAALAARHPDLDQRLRRFRELNGGFSNINPDELRAAFPAMKASEAGALAARFETSTN